MEPLFPSSFYLDEICTRVRSANLCCYYEGTLSMLFVCLFVATLFYVSLDICLTDFPVFNNDVFINA